MAEEEPAVPGIEENKPEGADPAPTSNGPTAMDQSAEELRQMAESALQGRKLALEKELELKEKDENIPTQDPAQDPAAKTASSRKDSDGEKRR